MLKTILEFLKLLKDHQEDIIAHNAEDDDPIYYTNGFDFDVAMGLCDNIEYYLDHKLVEYDVDDLRDYLKSTFPKWQGYSGNEMFPVKANESDFEPYKGTYAEVWERFLDGKIEYELFDFHSHYQLNMWQHAYGERRWQLIDFLITDLEMQTEYVQNVFLKQDYLVETVEHFKKFLTLLLDNKSLIQSDNYHKFEEVLGFKFSHQVGLCWNLNFSFSLKMGLKLYRNELSELMESTYPAWEKYSTLVEYPIQGGLKVYRDLKDDSGNFYIGEYGELRWELVEHMLKMINYYVINKKVVWLDDKSIVFRDL